MTPGEDPPPPGMIREIVTSLEMLRPPDPPALAAGLEVHWRIERAVRPALAFYRFLYDTVGENWLWDERRRWSDARLASIVQDPRIEVWVLYAEGQPGGYAELDRRNPKDVELSYFGLMPDFIGRGLGTALLRFAIRTAWVAATERLWVHTCTSDHPAALGLYQRLGFVPFRVHPRLVADPRLDGLMPRTAAPHIGLARQDFL